MSLSFIWKSAHRAILSNCSLVPRLLGCGHSVGNKFHSMCSNRTTLTSPLLEATRPFQEIARGMKSKGRLQLRCKDCYIAVRQGRRYVMCKTHPRHKQQQTAKAEKNTWILTHATQSKVRPW